MRFLLGQFLKRQSTAPREGLLDRREGLAVTSGLACVHILGEPLDSGVAHIAREQLVHGVHNRLRVGEPFLAVPGRTEHGDGFCRGDVRFGTRLLRFGLDLRIGEVFGGVIHTLRLIAHNIAIVQLHHAFAHRVDDLLIVRGHHNGGTGAVDRVQHFHDAQ